jgi:hypothetical protein
VDFLLVSAAVAFSVENKASGAVNTAMRGDFKNHFNGGFEINNVTDLLSDHYPVYASWLERQPIKLYH